MPRIIKNHAVIDDPWTLITAPDWEPSSGSGSHILPAELWLRHHASLETHTGVWLNSDEHPEIIHEYVDQLPLIAINFPDFTDGRGYSYARILRDQFGYRGELRAIGDILQDQLHYLYRCGFDAFAIRSDKDPEQALAGLTDFSHSYQAAYRTFGTALVMR